jgi:hypothetical protein
MVARQGRRRKPRPQEHRFVAGRLARVKLPHLASLGSTSRMIPAAPKPRYSPGTRLRVTQYVRVGDRRWLTRVEGEVVREGRRPVGGIEMGGKASYCQQGTLQLKRDDGEITEVALDEETQVEEVKSPAS